MLQVYSFGGGLISIWCCSAPYNLFLWKFPPLAEEQEVTRGLQAETAAVSVVVPALYPLGLTHKSAPPPR